MTGSFKKIDYRLRPAKHAERSMLIDLYKRLRFHPVEEYQYVGFGSVAFVDFRMVHRSLGLTKLTSIEAVEDEADKTRFENNKPYAGLDLRFGFSGDVLPTIDFSRPSLVWLDYDQPARRSMANDMASIAQKAPSGSFVAVTFTSQYPTEKKEAEKALGWLREGFPEFVPSSAKPMDFFGKKYSEFVRSTFSALFNAALSDADAGNGDASLKRRAEQVCFIKYKDGVEMATVGWLIVAQADDDKLADSALGGLPFYSPKHEPFRIDIPKVTPFEIREMERRLPSPQTSVELEWIPQNERSAFVVGYRYLPNFAPVEAI